MSRRALAARALAIMLIAVALCAPTLAFQWPDEGGIGGTGHVESTEERDQGGIGGTGFAPHPDEGGIGGTGLIAAYPDQGGIGGTGIIGVITGFGSIVVNGVHVDYPQDLPVDNLLGERGDVGQLAVGHVVEVEANAAEGRYLARRITQRHALIGAVSAQHPAGDELRVGAQRISLEGAKIAETTSLEIGSRIMVSGLWDGERLVATRIEPDRRDVDLLAGPARAGKDHGIVIGNIQVTGADRRGPPEEGRELVVTGRFDGERMLADALIPRPALPFDGRMRTLLIEGYPDQFRRQGLAPNPRPPGRQVIRLHTEDQPGLYRMREATPVQRLEQGVPDKPRPAPPAPGFNAPPGEAARADGMDPRQAPPPQRPTMEMRPAFPERDFPNPTFPARPSMMPGPPMGGRPGGRHGR